MEPETGYPRTGLEDDKGGMLAEILPYGCEGVNVPYRALDRAGVWVGDTVSKEPHVGYDTVGVAL